MNKLFDESVLKIFTALDNQVCLVGGCVRDYLLNRKVHDMDLATPLTPTQVMEKLTAVGIKVVPTGLKHGTVMAVIQHRGFEITTLRCDVQTDGRHADVVWTDDYALDAKRRDFTVNALYMDINGRIYDFVGGKKDLRARRIRFIGEANARIQEDYLRILRYFRFWGLIDTHEPDKELLSVLSQWRAGLIHVSKERKTEEFLKILMVPRVITVLKMTKQTGVLSDIVREAHIQKLAKFLRIFPQADVLQRLAILTGGQTGVLCLSNAQRKELSVLLNNHRVGLSQQKDKLFLAQWGQRVFAFHVWRAVATGWIDKKQARVYLKWKRPIFPIESRDLMDIGVPVGRKMGIALKQTERIWAELNFTSDKKKILYFYVSRLKKA